MSQCGGRVPRHKATGVRVRKASRREANPKDSLVRVKRQKKEGRKILRAFQLFKMVALFPPFCTSDYEIANLGPKKKGNR